MIPFLIIVFSIFALILLSSFFVYLFVFHRKKEGDPGEVMDDPQYKVYREETRAMVDKLRARAFEEVHIISFDGLRLFGRWYEGKKDSPVAVLCHGYKGSAYRDFSGGSDIFLSLGWNVLLIDQRAHGKSEGSTITFGVKEKYDALDWADYARERKKGAPIFLVGISMGGATVLMASAMAEERGIKGIAADCPYSSPYEIISKVMVDKGLKPSLLMPLVSLSAFLFGHFRLKSESAAEAVEKSSLPILIIHGLDDRFVPDYMSREIYERSKGNVEYETFPEAGHGLSYMVDRKRYVDTTVRFFSSLLES